MSLAHQACSQSYKNPDRLQIPPGGSRSRDSELSYVPHPQIFNTNKWRVSKLEPTCQSSSVLLLTKQLRSSLCDLTDWNIIKKNNSFTVKDFTVRHPGSLVSSASQDLIWCVWYAFYHREACFQSGCAVTCTNDEQFNTTVPPAMKLVSSRGSSSVLRRISQAGVDPDTVLAEARCQRSAPMLALTARWITRLAQGQLLSALRSDARTRGGRPWKEPEGKQSHMVLQVHTAETDIIKWLFEDILTLEFSLEFPKESSLFSLIKA